MSRPSPAQLDYHPDGLDPGDLPSRVPLVLRQRLAGVLRLTAAQQPVWPDLERVRRVRRILSEMPALVTAPEVDRLRRTLAAVSRGEAFLLRGGDCAETFSGNTPAHITGNLTTLFHMAVVLAYGAGVPVVKIARMAGQYAKPRSSGTDALGLPAYRGDIVNGSAPHATDRIPDPDRMLRAYHHASSALQMVRGARGGEVFVSHEALLMDYEASQVWPAESDDDRVYSGSAHFLWVGERTRHVDGAHIGLAGMLANPIGVKIGPSTTPEEVLEYARRLDPRKEPGRLTLITRMGHRRIREVLPAIVEAVTASGHRVVWECDPMHGNTDESPTGYKTRHFDHIVEEVRGFFEIHRTLGTVPGGIHVELTGDDVTECLGGTQGLADDDLCRRYETACDPRINRNQSIELAFQIAEMLRG